MKKPIKMIGKVFGKATVINNAGKKNKRYQYLCRCICGIKFIALGENLRSLHTQSCGCYQKSQARKAQETHKETSFYKETSEYRIWKKMRARCNCKTNPRYKDWGKRGIQVCKQWDNFAIFLIDMGRKPSTKHSIERINNNGNYEPSNCKWATDIEQGANKRNNVILTLNGKNKTMTQWSQILNIKYYTLQYRKKAGWNDKEILTTPQGEKRK